jgi:hypothetical protein
VSLEFLLFLGPLVMVVSSSEAGLACSMVVLAGQIWKRGREGVVVVWVVVEFPTKSHSTSIVSEVVV